MGGFMRLKNKKTGEIIDDGYVRETHDFQFDGQKHVLAVFKSNGHRPPERVSGAYNSLAELNEEWEDYEEPSKTIWQIKDSGELQDFEEDDFSDGYMESSKSIGNYFKTKEEAEKAVEKLKAVKRLKDKGFRFSGFVYTELCDYARVNIKATMINDSINDDLNLLFGGEE